MSEPFPYLGCGIGLRTPHYGEILAGPVGVDWFEIISENFMRPGGRPREVLRAIQDRFPLVMHGVSLSLGSVDPLNRTYLDDLARLCDEVQPVFASDHLCWGGVNGRYAHDLLPLPYTEEALAHVASRVAHVQERLGRRFLIENVSSYMAFRHSSMTEWEFLSELCRRTDCALLLDINNIFVSAHNHGFDPHAFIAGVPATHVAQMHLAGHMRRDTLLLDTHDHDVPEGVWALYAHAIATIGPRATLIERDGNIPPLADVVAEADRAATIIKEVAGPQPVAHGERNLRGARVA